MHGAATYLARMIVLQRVRIPVLKTTEKIFKYMRITQNYFLGLTLLISGKLSKRNPRARCFSCLRGQKAPLSTFDLKVNYILKNIKTREGSFSLRL